MTVPANPPSAAELRTLGVGAPYTATSVAATTAVDLTTKAAWPNSASPPPCASEIFCPTAGTFTGQLAGDTAAVAYAVTAGTVLRGAWVAVPATNALAVIARYGT